MAEKIHIHLGARWEPDLAFVLSKWHRTILDLLMLQAKANLRYGFRQITLQTGYLVRIGNDPGPPTQPRTEVAVADPQHHHEIATIETFFESNLPGRLPSPLTQPFARHLEVSDVIRVNNHCKTGRPCRGNLVRELFRIRSLITIFLNVHVPVRPRRHRNEVAELPDFWNAQPPRAVHILMFNYLRGGELINVVHKLFNSLSRLRQYLGKGTVRSRRNFGDNAVNVGGVARSRNSYG